MLENFTVQEILGGLLGFILFPLVLVIPGYVAGWLLNIFDFRARLMPVQFVIAIVLSNAIVPIVLYLAYSLVSAGFAIAIVGACLVAWIIILMRTRKSSPPPLSAEVRRYQTIALMMAGGWAIFCILCLVDIQIGNRLYFNSVSYDYATRVSMVDAMTRTGVPPINPSYYPGHPEKLTFLYFFWYILGSVVDTIGGSWVDAQAAFTASVAWCGICLMATIALYLRLRYKNGGSKVWQLSILAAQLLLVSGLDIIPVLTLLYKAKTLLGHLIFEGRMEGWNMPIMDWVGGTMWVPLHVSSMLACLTGLMLFLYAYDKDRKQQFIAACVSGVAFASAFGLSVWITFGFAIFWVIWAIALFVGQRRRQLAVFLALTGIVALVFAYPFLSGLTHSQSQSGGPASAIPITLYVRPFPIFGVFGNLFNLPQNLTNLLLLPLNYMFELGFFLVVGILWLRQNWKIIWKEQPHALAETILFFTIAITLSFVRSTILVINDFGIRAWLLGQFILLIWAIDLVHQRVRAKDRSIFSVFGFRKGQTRLYQIVAVFLTIGIMTTGLDMLMMRSWSMLVDANIVGFPNELSPDTHLGERTYAAKLAFDYVRDHTPQDAIVQDNPLVILSRPGGLYGSRQEAISDRTAYGVPTIVYEERAKAVGQIFQSENISHWDSIDKLCSQYFINVIIVNDVDPLWSSLPNLEQERSPLYQNQYYALFSCGGSAAARLP